MLRRLQIERFRGFAKLEAELSTISVLLGPNSCGKSSLLQAVRFACAALSWTLKQNPEPKPDNDWIVVWWNWPIPADVGFLPPTHTEELFLNKGGEPLSVWLSFDEEDFVQELKVQLWYGRNAALKLDVRVKSQKALDTTIAATKKKSKYFSQRLAEALKGKEPIALSIPSFYGVVHEEAYVSDARLERLLAAGEQGNVVRNLVSRLGGLKELSDFLRGSVGAEIVRSTSGQAIQEVEALTAHFRDNNGDLELAAAGTGLVALTALYSALKWYALRATQERPLLFLLDEPEAHLHPMLQGKTGERIADLVQSFGAQAMMATHSVEMINRLGLRPDTVLLSIDRSAANAAVPLSSEDEVIGRLESFCDLSPFTSLQLLRSRRILFHEGKSDWSILEGCARALFSNHASNLENIRRWTAAELCGVSNADAKDVLKTAIAPLAAQSKGGGIFRIVRILDRDYRRKPVLGPEQGNTAVKEFDVVWSRHSIESLFLEPSCLGAWLELAFKGHPQAPSLLDLEKWIGEGIQSANTDATLNQAVSNELFALASSHFSIGQADSPKHHADARRQIETQILAEPHILQQGKARAHHILRYVRAQLPPSLQNRVRRDISDMIRHAPAPSTLISPALVPPEIEALLKYMAAAP